MKHKKVAKKAARKSCRKVAGKKKKTARKKR